ncbi:PREDICTED: uncharacterized protein LOC109127245 [Camelina sativa]|uniref:Uncharacterized protein LOC109127245 n=1 Tax=Camelina sativa TaxID=90675 RepID=A0ABM1QKQ6_CAMSA|nr:PREDICTED: uncharacterized protein LOC109127245 [Camelina sativa]
MADQPPRTTEYGTPLDLALLLDVEGSQGSSVKVLSEELGSSQDGAATTVSKGLGLGQKPWLKAAQKHTFTKQAFVVTEIEGKQCVVVPKDVFVDAKPLWEDFVTGKFLNSKAPIESTRHIILNRGMWSIGGLPMILSKWTPFAEEEQPTLKSVPLWVVLKNIPHTMFTNKGLQFLSSAVGTPIRLHPKTEACSSFDEAQILVEADLTKTLPVEYHLAGEEEGELDIVVKYSYPWLPPQCSQCRKWGHLQAACLKTALPTESEVVPTILAVKETEIVGTADAPAQEIINQSTEVVLGTVDAHVTKTMDIEEAQEWITPQKTGHKPMSSSNKQNTLVQTVAVPVLSNSYSVLSEGDEDEAEEDVVRAKEAAPPVSTHVGDSIAVPPVLPSTAPVSVVPAVGANGRGVKPTVTLRESIPRASKISHKYVSNPSTQPQRDPSKSVRDWVKRGNFQFGCILETRVKETKAAAILASVFPDWSYLTNYTFNRRGRIWVVWNSSVRLTPCYTSSQVITCSVLLEGAEKEFFVSFVYAANGVDDRKVLWEDLKFHQDSPLFRNKPWMVFGDFNEILKADEHSLFDIQPMVSPGMRDFQEVVQHCSFSDLQSHGPMYTWCNKREFGLICKKLDMVLVNDIWLLEYQQSYGVFEAGGCSHHLQCRIIIGGDKPKLRRPFKFCNALVDDEKFLPMVKDFWDGSEPLYHSTSALYRFSKKLKALKPHIKLLSRDRLGNLEKRAKDAFEHLCTYQIDTLQNPTDQTMQRKAVAYSRWLFVSGLEEKFLKQKSKLHWLKVGDGNSRTFHRAAKAREARNAIKEIQCPDGRLADTQETIKQEAERFFREFLGHRLSNYHALGADELLSLLPYRCT